MMSIGDNIPNGLTLTLNHKKFSKFFMIKKRFLVNFGSIVSN